MLHFVRKQLLKRTDMMSLWLDNVRMIYFCSFVFSILYIFSIFIYVMDNLYNTPEHTEVNSIFPDGWNNENL